MRVTQRTMYNSIIERTNSTLWNLNVLSEQSQTEKKVNRPSDDPAGTATILSLRASLSDIDDFYKNTNTAKGWLTLADGVLQQVSTMIIEAKTKDLQGATGTVSPENRDQIATQLRQIYEQLIVLGNQQYAGQHIFAGHKTANPPFEQCLSANTNDPNLKGLEFDVEGSSKRSAVIQFLDSGEIGTDALDYRYSTDAGLTWTTKTLAAGDKELVLDGVVVNLHDNAGPYSVTAVDPANEHENDNGSWIWVHPTARYVGDDKDQTWVDQYGSAGVTSATAQGVFSREVVVRVDQNIAGLPAPGDIMYSYSTDGGSTWVEGNKSDASVTPARLLVPGGFLNITATSLDQGDQFYIRSRRANIDLEIAPGQMLTINNVGKEIFGGIYQDPGSAYATPVFDGDAKNLFETIGRLIGYAENNNQQGFQQELANLEDSHKVILTSLANIGGRINRCATAKESLETVGGSETQALSNVEDVDYIKLMTQLAQQEFVYQSVLKSSSMLMQLSLLNFI